jgi:CDP-glycerol glycerophosphotransferase (TagB/SpsB family)
MVDGHDFMYGPRIHHPTGELKYTRIFESSEIRQKKFINEKPELREVIALVGDLRVDNLRAKTIASRKGSELERRRPHVLIAGSWNPHNLFEKMGTELLGAAMKVQNSYCFSLRPHPHMLRSSAPGNWREFFNEQGRRGFTLSMPDSDLGDALAAADVVICDDLSSVALYAAVLQRPIILVKSASSQIPEGSFPDRLGRVVPELHQADQLGDMLGFALDHGPSPELLSLAAEMNSRPGQSVSLVRQEVYKLLQLTPP